MTTTLKFAKKDIPADVVDALANGSFDGNAFRFAGQLDRRVYVDAAKVLEALGGKWNRKAKATLFPTDAREALAVVLDAGKVPEINPYDFYPTPDHVVDQMIELAQFRHAHRYDILEPSAGEGAILGQIIHAAPSAAIDAVEIDPGRSMYLADRFARQARFFPADFLTWAAPNRYDRVLMNPPFKVEGLDAGWAHHILRAWDIVRPGGILVAITPRTAPDSRSQVRRRFASLVIERIVECINLDDDTFEGTEVRSQIVALRKD